MSEMALLLGMGSANGIQILEYFLNNYECSLQSESGGGYTSREKSIFELNLNRSIVEGLDELGKDMSKTVLFHICRKKGIEKEEIVAHIELFVRGMEEIFGEGSQILEHRILERLNSKVRLMPVLKGELRILDYVKLYKQVNETGKKVQEI